MTREQGGSIRIRGYNPDGSAWEEHLSISIDNGRTWQPNPRLLETHPHLYEEQK